MHRCKHVHAFTIGLDSPQGIHFGVSSSFPETAGMGIPTSTNEEADTLVEGNTDDEEVDGKTDIDSTQLEGNTEVEVAVKDGR